MIDVTNFVDAIVGQGARFFTGVPCSYLTPLINEVISRDETCYVLASSEGDAVSIASGIWLGGQMAVVLCQNSGLGNMVNPLTSLNAPFRIPVLLLVTWRGKPGTKDEPQHALMGQITLELLTLLGIEWAHLPEDEAACMEALQVACNYIRREQRPYALVMAADIFSSTAPAAPLFGQEELPTRQEALTAFLDSVPADAVVVATTGKTGRELFSLSDRPGHLYCVGSMGYANALAHGIALSSQRQVYVLDGDGAAIMHLGNLTSIGASRPASLTHIVLDNGCYDSTGAQPSAAASVDFVAVAMAAGYAQARHCVSCADLGAALGRTSEPGPRLLHMAIRAGSMAQLGRPTEQPAEVARRLRRHLATPVEHEPTLT